MPSGERITEELCRHYRALGICVVVSEANSDAFFHWLIQSGIARKYYLEGVKAEGGGEPAYRRASFVDPILDAVAARQWKLAAELATLSSPTWIEGEEYEDDFLYAEFWRQTLTGDKKHLPALADRWRAVLEGGSDLRLELVTAFLGGDSNTFAEALRTLLAWKEDEAKKIAAPKADSILADDYPFYPNRWISVEGLAWLALAERQGIRTEGSFLGCPDVVRVASYAPYQPVAYPDLPLL